MDGKTSKNIGSAVRFIIIARDFIGGLTISFVLLVVGIIFFFADTKNGEHNLVALLLFLALSLAALGLTCFQLYRRLSQRKYESTSMAYQATDGNVAINKASSLRSDIDETGLINQTIKGWVGPVFSNQNIHIVGVAVDRTPNTENSLLLTEKFLVGLTIGPGGNSTSTASHVLNMLPVSNVEKLAMGGIFDSDAIKQNIEREIASNQVTELLRKYNGFAVPIADIKNVTINNNSIEFEFKDNRKRSWVQPSQDGRLQNFYAQVRDASQTTSY